MGSSALALKEFNLKTIINTFSFSRKKFKMDSYYESEGFPTTTMEPTTIIPPPEPYDPFWLWMPMFVAFLAGMIIFVMLFLVWYSCRPVDREYYDRLARQIVHRQMANERRRRDEDEHEDLEDDNPPSSEADHLVDGHSPRENVHPPDVVIAVSS